MSDLSKETSPTGSVTTYDHDVYGNLTKTTDPVGNTTSYTLDSAGQVTRYTKPNGASYDYTYDSVHRLTSITSPLGLKRELTYGTDGNLAKETDQLGRSTTYTYDVMGDMISSTNAKGATTSYAYSTGGDLVSSLNTYGGQTSYTYDSAGQLTSVKDPLGKVTTQTYDPTGNITSVTKPGGRTTAYTYDANGNQTSQTTPLGNTTTTTYDKNNRKTSVTSPAKSTTTYLYDAASRISKVTDPAGNTSTLGYDANSNQVSATNPLGNVTKYSYDSADRLTSVTDALDQTTSYTYDSDSNVTSVKDPDGNTTTYGYDAEDNLTSVVDPQNAVKSFTYDVAGRITEAKTSDGAKTSYNYDKLNELVGKNYSSDSSQNSTFGYDSAGNRVKMTDGSGKSSYTYDLLGRVKSVTNGQGKTVTYTYNEADLVSSITYADGSKVSYGYDLDNNLTTVVTAQGTTTYTYDCAGRLTSVTRPNGTVTYYTYDANSNIIALLNDDKRKKLLSGFKYTYDERNYIATEVATASNGDITNRAFTYDSAGQLSQMTEDGPNHSNTYTYTYDSRGNKIKEVRAGTGAKSISTYTYDSANRLLEEDSSTGGKTTYTYDSAGNLIAKKGATSDFTYEYSVESRLKAVRTGGALLMAVSYDGDGNRTFEVDRKVVPFGVSQSNKNAQNADTSTSAGSTDNTNQSDDHDPLAATGDKRASGNSNGATAGLTTNSYQRNYVDPADTVFWYGFGQGILQLGSSLNQALTVDLTNWFSDVWNSITSQYKLLIRSDNTKGYSANDIKALRGAGLSDQDIYDVTHPAIIPANQNGSQQSGGTNSAAGSDASGSQPGANGSTNQITIPAFPDQDSRIDYELTYYVNDTNTQNTQVLSEYGATGSLRDTFSYGAAGRVSATEAGHGTNYYLPDGRGSVSQLTDSAGSVLTSYTYSPFGEVTSGALAQTTDLAYNSEEYDSTLGLQYLRARYYDPQMAHFGVQDSVLGNTANPASYNLYGYAQPNPVNYADPSGHVSIAGLSAADSAAVLALKTLTYNTVYQALYKGTTAFSDTAENQRDQRVRIVLAAAIEYKKYGGTTAFGGTAQNQRDTYVASQMKKATNGGGAGNPSNPKPKTKAQQEFESLAARIRKQFCHPDTQRANSGVVANTPNINANPFSVNIQYRVLTKYMLISEMELYSKFTSYLAKAENVALFFAEILVALKGFAPIVGFEALKFDEIYVRASYTFQVVLVEQFPSSMYYDSLHRLIVKAGKTDIVAVKNVEKNNIDIFTGALEPLSSVANAININIRADIQQYADSYMATYFPQIKYTMG